MPVPKSKPNPAVTKVREIPLKDDDDGKKKEAGLIHVDLSDLQLEESPIIIKPLLKEYLSEDSMIVKAIVSATKRRHIEPTGDGNPEH